MKFIYYLSVLLSIHLINADNVPVLSYFGGSSSDQSESYVVGQVTDSNDFKDFLKQSLKTYFPIEIIEVEQLNDEDIRFVLDKTQHKKSVDYKPLVKSPYQSLISYLDEHNLKYELIKFNDAKEALNEFFKKTELSNKLTVILTGKSARKVEQNNDESAVASGGIESETGKSRNRRQSPSKVEATSNNNETFYFVGDSCSALFNSIYIINQTVSLNSDKLYLNISTSSYVFQCDNSTASLDLQLTDANEAGITSLELNFQLVNRYWFYTNANVTTEKETFNLIYMGSPYSVETPADYSFACTRAYFKYFSNKTESTVKIALYIDNIQIQPFNVNVTNATAFTFGRVNYCQGFFTSGIWMAIVSSLLFAFILSCGVSFLLKVNTMDRFDDPKGKQLTIAMEK